MIKACRLMLLLLILIVLLEPAYGVDARERRVRRAGRGARRGALPTGEVANLTVSDIMGGDPVRSDLCLERRKAEMRATEDVQRRIHGSQHPRDCSAAALLLCLGDLPNSHFAASTLGAGEKGLGVRVMYYGRCITRALMSGRAAVLRGAEGSKELLRLFKPWGSCTLADVEKARAGGTEGRVVEFDPSYDAPFKAAGTREGTHLVPRAYMDKGVLWWKAQELHYLLRPSDELAGLVREQAAKLKLEVRGGGGGYAGVHKRSFGRPPRGCSEGAGECFIPGKTFPVEDYLKELEGLRPFDPRRPVLLASDAEDLSGEARKAEARFGVRVVRAGGGGGGGASAPYKYAQKEARRAAVDLLLLAGSHPLAFTWTSYFGVAAAMLKMAREGFCTSWVSLEHPPLVPKRAFTLLWPNPGYIAQGGFCYLQSAKGHIEDLQGAGGDPRGMHCVLVSPWDSKDKLNRRVSLDCRC